MPYLLAFWRDADDRPREPNLVFDALCDRQTVDGLALLSRSDIVKKFQEVFDPIIPRVDEAAWENSQDMFLL